MKLIKAAIPSYQTLKQVLPRVAKYLHETPNKLFNVYTLGSLDVFYIETYDHTDVLIRSRKRKVTNEEVSFVIDKLFPDVPIDSLQIDHEFISKLTDKPSNKYRQIVLIRKN